MKLKNQHEHVLVKNDDYEIAIVAEGNLLVEWFSWFVATIVSIGFFVYIQNLSVLRCGVTSL